MAGWKRAFGVAMIAMVIGSALAAPGALASTGRFTAIEAGTKISGAQVSTHKIVTDAGTVKCTTIEYNGAIGAPSTETLTITPTYEKCQVGSTFETHVHLNGCDYLFSAGAALVGSEEIKCPAGKVIDFEVTKIVAEGGGVRCHITVGPQSLGKSITYSNPSEGHVKFAQKSTGVVYTLDSTGCGGTSGEHSNGSIEGETELSGEGFAVDE